MSRRPPSSTLFPYTTLSRSGVDRMRVGIDETCRDEAVRTVVFVGHRLHQLPRFVAMLPTPGDLLPVADHGRVLDHARGCRSEEHTSELQSQSNLVCRLLLET